MWVHSTKPSHCMFWLTDQWWKCHYITMSVDCRAAKRLILANRRLLICWSKVHCSVMVEKALHLTTRVTRPLFTCSTVYDEWCLTCTIFLRSPVVPVDVAEKVTDADVLVGTGLFSRSPGYCAWTAIAITRMTFVGKYVLNKLAECCAK